MIDLASVVVVARDQAGATSPLVAYDPGGEIRALRIAAHRSGQERIEYHAPGDDEAPRVAPIAEELAALRRQRDALAATAERSPAGSPDVRPAVEALDQAIAALEARLPVRPPTSASASPARLCADVGRIDGSSTAPRWTCLVPPRVD
ncbi:MAG TPA: hypothetical protein VMJ10_32450 [Kofleriaceae bacterium]|nr:hypothetical protein [Kofleriaceae bacterium]